MAWLESHQSLRYHPKKDHLAELLYNGSVPNDAADFAAIGILHAVWYWALDFAQDGDLARFSDRQIAKGVGWHGDPHTLVQALTAAGFLDEDRHLHDWDEYGGKLLLKREQERERKAKWRSASTSAGQDAGQDADGARRKQTVHNKEKSFNSRRPVDNSTVRPTAAKKPVDNGRGLLLCWRCGEEICDGECVESSKGLRHKTCTAATP